MYATFWAGIAGAAYASYLQYIDSTAFNTDEGFNILSMVIIGGQGTLVGPLVGAVIVNTLSVLAGRSKTKRTKPSPDQVGRAET